MKIDVSRIVSAHIRTLKDSGTGRYNALDLALFWGLPSVCPVAFQGLGCGFNAGVVKALLTGYSIFAGLLLNLLILVYTFSTQREHPSALARVRSQLVKELHDNIAYSILVSIILVVISMSAVAYVKMFDPAKWTAPWVTGCI